MCEGWARQQRQPVDVRVFPGVQHSEILFKKAAFVAALEAIAEGDFQQAEL